MHCLYSFLPRPVMFPHKVGNLLPRKGSTHAQAYSSLVSVHEHDESDKAGTLLLAKLKGVLAGEQMSVI